MNIGGAMRPGAARVGFEQAAEEQRLAREGVDGLRREGWSDADILHMAQEDPEADRAFEREMAAKGKTIAAWRVKRNIKRLLTQ